MTIETLKISKSASMIEVEKTTMIEMEIRRRVIKQEDLEDSTGYERHKDTRRKPIYFYHNI
jgi:hypothetical protein